MTGLGIRCGNVWDSLSHAAPTPPVAPAVPDDFSAVHFVIFAHILAKIAR